jgi:hypothetical protein
VEGDAEDMGRLGQRQIMTTMRDLKSL